jgi:hypothetical protein
VSAPISPGIADQFVVPPVHHGRCALCGVSFLVGDQYKAVWMPGRFGLPGLGLNVHQTCYGQLAPGDVARIFAALERGLALPLRVLAGERVEVG